MIDMKKSLIATTSIIVVAIMAGFFVYSITGMKGDEIKTPASELNPPTLDAEIPSRMETATFSFG